jgi:hypothetical protein
VTDVGEPTAYVPVHVVGVDDGLFGQAPASGHDHERERLGTTRSSAATPMVNTVIGSANLTNSGHTTALRRPITAATAKAEPQPGMSTLGMRAERTKSVTAVTTTRPTPGA